MSIMNKILEDIKYLLKCVHDFIPLGVTREDFFHLNIKYLVFWAGYITLKYGFKQKIK